MVIRTLARLKPTEACNRPHMHNRCIQSGPAFREHRHRVGGASHLISLGASKSLSAISSLSTWRAGRGIEILGLVQHSQSQLCCFSIPRHLTASQPLHGELLYQVPQTRDT
jgi:hypothetical protein